MNVPKGTVFWASEGMSSDGGCKIFSAQSHMIAMICNLACAGEFIQGIYEEAGVSLTPNSYTLELDSNHGS